MSSDPVKAWQTVLAQLQMDMPRASFDTWVRDTCVVSCDDTTLVIGAHNSYARDWLESRLTSTVSRLLVGILNRQVEVEFVVLPSQAEPGDQVEEQEQLPEEDQADVRIVNRLRYDELVSPSRVVAIPGYFSRLIPEIGARNAWLYVGWRQAVWNGESDTSPRSRRVPVRRIVRFSGMSRRTFFRAVEDESTWQSLAGLVERNDTTPRWTQGQDHRSHRIPNQYTVHMTLPLSRADSHTLATWLGSRMENGTTLLNALRQAVDVKNMVGELLAVPELDSPPAAGPFDFPTVMDIAAMLNEGPLSPDLQEAAEALHRRIISGFGTLLLTHYFLETVIPKTGLTPPQAWLVALLRDRCYVNRQTNEVRDEAIVRGGYAELAEWLGIARPKTIWEWVRDPKGAVSAFVDVLPPREGDEPDTLRLRVRLEEPLFDGANGTHKMAELALSDGADDTHKLAQMAPLDGAVDTTRWREWHSLKYLNTDSNTDQTHPTTCEEPVAAPSDWNLRKLLLQGNAHPRVVKELLSANASAQAFVSWLLFACSPAGRGIQRPVAYALSSLKEDPVRGAGQAFDALAALPPAELVRLIHWSIQSSGRFGFGDPSGNGLWDQTMGASGEHAVLLAILLGDGSGAPAWERRETSVSVDGEEVRHETEIIQTRRD
jgi:hypothetical protein